ncbi:MAG TPA: glycosyltransferase family 4 protein [Acidimicrobiales bacterium]|jgi:glycosyltransferase involved in cell wall biosynthesis
MRIALLTDLYPPYIGGQPIRFQELATRLAARGHDVTVYCVRTHPSSPATATEDGVRVVRGPLDERYDDPVVAATKRGVRSTARYALGVRRALRSEGFDVAYFNQWPFLHVLLAPRAARRRAAIDWCELRSGPIYGAVQRVLPRLVAGNLCVNDLLASRLEAASGVAVGYLPSGVATERYWSAPRDERRGLLFLGRLVDTKDVPLLIAGYGEVWRRGFHRPLLVAGDGTLAPVLERALGDLPEGARRQVEVLGKVSDDEKVRLLATAEALVVSSKREGFPVVVAEAMASGLPVATVDRPDNGTAHVVARYGVGASGPPDPSGLADAIEAVLARWDECSQRGRAAAPELHWDRIVDQWIVRAEVMAGGEDGER